MKTALVVSIVLTAYALTAWASKDASTVGQVSGAPGEGTCADCHLHLNDGPGSTSFFGLGGTYDLDELFEMGFSIAHSGQGRWGFMVTALDGANQPAGTFAITDVPRTRLLSINGRSYVAHTQQGTDAGVTHQDSWEFRWFAPSTNVGPVTFYVAAVAANNNNNETGDYTYTRTFTLGYSPVFEESESGIAREFRLMQNQPNPFNAGTAIGFTLPRDESARLVIFDILGRAVTTLADGPLAAGSYTYEWDGRVDGGRNAATGVYFYRLSTPSRSETKQMVLLR